MPNAGIYLLHQHKLRVALRGLRVALCVVLMWSSKAEVRTLSNRYVYLRRSSCVLYTVIMRTRARL